jgi:hypothetical protein
LQSQLDRVANGSLDKVKEAKGYNDRDRRDKRERASQAQPTRARQNNKIHDLVRHVNRIADLTTDN